MRQINLLEGNLLDRWEYECNNFGGGNAEKQMYVDSPEFAAMDYTRWTDGELRITAKRKETNICGHTMPYSSGRIRTKRRLDFQYGNVSFLAQLPYEKGMWPAVWLLPTENVYGPWPSSGEIDILEAKNDESHIVYHAAHFGTSFASRKCQSRKVMTGQTGGDWHSYGLVWTPEGISWYVDGANTFSVSMGKPFDQKFHLIVNMAVSGEFTGHMEPDPGWEQSSMHIRDFILETE